MKAENISGVVAGQAAWGNVSTVICDLDGVIYVDGTGISGAGRALARMAEAEIDLVFVTNNSSKTRSDVRNAIEQATGYMPEVASIVTSGMATASYCGDHVSRAYVMGGLGLTEELDAAGVKVVGDWREAEAVVVGLDRELSYERLTGATLAIRAGAEFIASNTDATYPGSRGLYPGGGAIAAALQTATGVAPVVCGKPHQPMRELVGTMVKPGVVVVGDRPETDIAIAKAEGWGSALVLTGVVHPGTHVIGEHAPDVVIESIAVLPDVLGLA